MKNSIFEHLKEDVTLFVDKNQTMAINIDFFEDVRKQLEKFSLNFFQAVIHFYRSHLQLKTLANNLCALI